MERGRGKDAEYRRRYSERAFWRKLSGLPRTAGMAVVERAVTLYVVLTDRDTPMWARALVVAALGYFIVPMDAVPDAVPFAGLADDVAVMGAALAQLGRLVTPAVRGRVQRLLPEGLRADTDTDADAKAERPARGKPRKRRSAKHGKAEGQAQGGLRGRQGGAGGGTAAGRQPTRVDRAARAERAAGADAEAKANSESEDKENEET